MVIVEHSRDGRRVRIQARSNFSLGRGGFLTLIITLSVVTLLLAAVASGRGYWPILAIAVVQVALLVPILLHAWKSAWAVETITIENGKVRVLRETWKNRQQLKMDKAWTRVWIEQPRRAWYPPRVMLGSESTRVELGTQLNTTQRHKLANAMREAILATAGKQIK